LHPHRFADNVFLLLNNSRVFFVRTVHLPVLYICAIVESTFCKETYVGVQDNELLFCNQNYIIAQMYTEEKGKEAIRFVSRIALLYVL
jgi:hypothetical protein